MTQKRLDHRFMLSETEHAELQYYVKLWMRSLDSIPVLMLAQHRESGGLVAIPLLEPDPTTEDILEILQSAIDYIKST